MEQRDRLRQVSLIVACLGGVGSICLMLMSGLRPPVFLIILFIGWVFAPFAFLVLAIMISRRWSALIRKTTYTVTFVISILSLAVYTYVLFRPPASQPAFPYVAVPVVSGAAIVLSLAVAALVSRGQTREVDQ